MTRKKPQLPDEEAITAEHQATPNMVWSMRLANGGVPPHAQYGVAHNPANGEGALHAT